MIFLNIKIRYTNIVILIFNNLFISIMKIYKLYFLFLLLPALFLFTDCAKKGCTDPNAINYDSEAERDDESCEYQANLLVWINESTSDSLISHSINELTVNFDNENIGTYQSDLHFTESPYCTEPTAFVYQKTWGEHASQEFAYKITDALGNILWQGNMPLQPNVCNSIQFIW